MTADEEWARHLLSGLPAPRMPDDVRSRLASAIADEAAQSAQAAKPPRPPRPRRCRCSASARYAADRCSRG